MTASGIPQTRALAWSLWALFVSLFSFATVASLVGLTPGDATGGIPFLIMATIGAFVASRWAQNPIGWAMLGFTLLVALLSSGSLYVTSVPLTAVGVHAAFAFTLAAWFAAARFVAGRAFDRFSMWTDRTVTAVPFRVLFSLYAGITVVWLVAGLLPALAAYLPGARGTFAALAENGALPSLLADAARRILSEAQQARPVGSVAFAYLISALNLTLGIFVIRLRGSDLTARAFSVGLVGTAAVFNFQAHSALAVIPPFGYVHAAFHAVSGVSYMLALLLFPDGRLVVHLPHASWLAWPTRVLYVLLPLAGLLLFESFHGDPVGFVVFFGVLIPIVGVTAQALRYRQAATASQRQQSRVLLWVLSLAFTAALLVGLASLIVAANAPALSPRILDTLGEIAFFVFPALFAVIPVSLVVVMLRYHLWDVDRIVNRALVYSLATGVLALIYAATVFLLNAILAPLTQGSELAVAGSTLVVWALFRPARDGIQEAVDRRFFRHRYDAEKTLEEFSARLRSHVELDTLERELLAVVRDTMQPAHVSLWLRESQR